MSDGTRSKASQVGADGSAKDSTQMKVRNRFGTHYVSPPDAQAVAMRESRWWQLRKEAKKGQSGNRPSNSERKLNVHANSP